MISIVTAVLNQSCKKAVLLLLQQNLDRNSYVPSLGYVLVQRALIQVSPEPPVQLSSIAMHRK